MRGTIDATVGLVFIRAYKMKMPTATRYSHIILGMYIESGLRNLLVARHIGRHRFLSFSNGLFVSNANYY